MLATPDRRAASVRTTPTPGTTNTRTVARHRAQVNPRVQPSDLRHMFPLNDPAALVQVLGMDAGSHREGAGVKICCPVHGDRTASCSVRLGPDGTVQLRCFGCDLAGDAMTLIGVAHRCERDFPATMKRAADLCGLSLDGDRPRRPAPVRAPIPQGPAVLSIDEFNLVAQLLVDLCPVTSQPDVARYLSDRHIRDEVSARWGALPKDRGALAALRDTLVQRCGADLWERSGLAHQHRGAADKAPCRPDCAQTWCWPSHRLLIPWRCAGVAGTVQTLQRRLLRPLKPGERIGKYVFPARRQPLQPFGSEDAAELLGAGMAVVFTEGAVDAVSLTVLSRRLGKAWVCLGVPGVEGWCSSWGEWARGRDVVIALDPDRAGEGAVAALGRDCLDRGAVRVLRARPTGGGDWNDSLRGAS